MINLEVTKQMVHTVSVMDGPGTEAIFQISYFWQAPLMILHTGKTACRILTFSF